MNIAIIIIGFFAFLKILGLIYVVFFKKNKSESFSYLQIKPSHINGEGVFTTRKYKKDEIILSDIFPGAPTGVDPSKGWKYLSKFGKKFNHCSKNFNIDLQLINGRYGIVAIANIDEGDELVANYDRVHSKFPFISGSEKTFKKC